MTPAEIAANRRGILCMSGAMACFIPASKLVYDYISGFQQPHKDGTSKLVEGRLLLFRKSTSMATRSADRKRL